MPCHSLLLANMTAAAPFSSDGAGGIVWGSTFDETFFCAARLRGKADSGWLLSQGAKVLTMQAGFGLVESSFTRKMNSANIMTKNIADLVMSSFFYMFVGSRHYTSTGRLQQKLI